MVKARNTKMSFDFCITEQISGKANDACAAPVPSAKYQRTDPVPIQVSFIFNLRPFPFDCHALKASTLSATLTIIIKYHTY